MTRQELFDRYSQYYRYYPTVGIALDISRMGFGQNFLSSKSSALRNAFEEMRSLEAGEIANPDEKRMVGHYWLRNAELAPTAEIRTAITSTVQAVKRFAADIHSGTIRPERADKFRNVLLLGIGGSALGPQLVADALWEKNRPMEIYYSDNTDPDGMSRVLSEVNLAETLTIVISKSGGTVETANANLEVAHAYKDAGLSFAKHAVAITCTGSKLDKRAAEEGWLKRFEMWDWVGGRTSLFSTVGLVPASLLGLNIDELLAGARDMDIVTRDTNTETNPAGLLALMWHYAGEGRGAKDMVVLPYKDRLVLFSKYLQQLVMESLGKEHDRSGAVVNQGIAVYGNKGSTDQHAYVQQLRDGVHNFFVTFIEVMKDYVPGAAHSADHEVKKDVRPGDYLKGFFLGTREALFEKGRESITVTIDELNTRSLGSLIALYERAVGFYASLINVNAYHQPGVEAGKKAAEKVVELQQKLFDALSKTPESASTLAARIGAPDEAETVFKILEHLEANGRNIARTGERGPQTALYAKA